MNFSEDVSLKQIILQYFQSFFVSFASGAVPTPAPGGSGSLNALMMYEPMTTYMPKIATPAEITFDLITSLVINTMKR